MLTPLWSRGTPRGCCSPSMTGSASAEGSADSQCGDLPRLLTQRRNHAVTPLNPLEKGARVS